jgi:DNA-binding NarL/FixJ family response regulator
VTGSGIDEETILKAIASGAKGYVDEAASPTEFVQAWEGTAAARFRKRCQTIEKDWVSLRDRRRVFIGRRMVCKIRVRRHQWAFSQRDAANVHRP